MSETQLSKSIKTALEKSGAWVLRIQSGIIPNGRGGFIHMAPRGTPDLLVMHPCWCWLEIKPPNGAHHDKRTLESQQKFRDRCGRLGIAVAVVTSTEQALAFVRGVERTG